MPTCGWPARCCSHCHGGGAATDVAARTGPAIIGMQVQGSGRLAHGQRVPLPRVLQALGTPSQREPSPYECGSAYDEGDIQLLSWAGQAWESDGRTAMLRRFDVGREGALLLANGTQIGARNSPADVLQQVPRAHRSGDTEGAGQNVRCVTDSGLSGALTTGRLLSLESSRPHGRTAKELL